MKIQESQDTPSLPLRIRLRLTALLTSLFGGSAAAATPLDNGDHHYIYFASSQAANAFARSLDTKRFAAEVRATDDDARWLVLVKHPHLPDQLAFDRVERELTTRAGTVGGEYDGWERPGPGP